MPDATSASSPEPSVASLPSTSLTTPPQVDRALSPDGTTSGAPIYQSTPAKTGRFYAEHKRDEVADFSMLEHELIPIVNDDALLDILNTAGAIPHKPANMVLDFPCSKSFIEDLNKASECIHEKYFKDSDVELIVATNTECSKHRNHPTNTECRPDITLAPKSRWETLSLKWKKTLSWPWADLVGEIASAGDKDPLIKTVTYAHYWLLARPDRKVALSFLTTLKSVTFFVSTEGTTTTLTRTVDWDSPSLSRIVFAFLYRLYSPGSWVRTGYKQKFVGMEPLFDITIDGKTYENFRPIYACKPFSTRTHVCANPEAGRVDGGPLVTVIKDQLSRNTRRFEEDEVYKQIHGGGHVPGVAHAHLFATFGHSPNEARSRRITGLEEYGSAIMEATTLQDVLEILFDILEVMRYLYVSRKVLHRDISKGNVLFSKEYGSPQSKEEHPDLCFIGHLLDPGERHRYDTRALLIDYNNAVILGKKQEERREGNIRTGTPGFVARAVENNGPLPFDSHYTVPDIPSAPDVYKTQHKERVKKFPMTALTTYTSLPEDYDAQLWRHDLDHDAESVYWLLVYWLMAAQPIVHPPRTKNRLRPPSEFIDLGAWASFAGKWGSRNSFITGSVAPEAFHPIYKPLVALIRQVGRTFAPDRHWLPKEDPRKHPVYALEAFQRLILQFILDNRGADFMSEEIDTANPRTPGDSSKAITPSCTAATMSHSAALDSAKRKRETEHDAQVAATSAKKPRHDAREEGSNQEDSEEENADDEGGESAPYTGRAIWEELTMGQRIIIGMGGAHQIVPCSI